MIRLRITRYPRYSIDLLIDLVLRSGKTSTTNPGWVRGTGGLETARRRSGETDATVEKLVETSGTWKASSLIRPDLKGAEEGIHI